MLTAYLRNRLNPRLVGVFLQLGPLLTFLLLGLKAEFGPEGQFLPVVQETTLVTAVAGLAGLGALAIFVSLRFGKALLLASLLASLLFGFNQLYLYPSYGFLWFCFTLVLAVNLINMGKIKATLNVETYFAPLFLRISSFYAAGLGLLVWSAQHLSDQGPTFIDQTPTLFLLELTSLYSAAVVLALFWRQTFRAAFRPLRLLSFFIVLALLLGKCVLAKWSLHDLQGLLWLPHALGLAFSFSLPKALQSGKNLVDLTFHHPEGSIILTFAIFCLGGGLLLALPLSTTSHQGISFIDSMFTAVSAVCVTGLTVVDTTSEFSSIGKALILFLIQLGGLGIMAVSSLSLLFLGQRLSLQQEKALTGVLGQKLRGEILPSFYQVLRITFLLEGLGTVCLSYLFWQEGQSLPQALWSGLFTSVSAFCNAGFALNPDSLISFQNNSALLLIVSLLILCGGLSPAFIAAIPSMARGKNYIPLQFKFVLIANTFLLLAGWIFLVAVEWHGSLAELSFGDKLSNAWLMGVTTRTAGFNSVPLDQLNAASLVLMMALMYLGGSPGGTAGGIKTTTFMVLCSTVISTIFGKEKIEAFQRQIPNETVYKASTVVALSLLIGFATLLGILLTQTLPPMTALFEVVSALGTVGLTLGGTAQLDTVGKILIMLCMFMGRVGSYSILIYLAQRSKKVGWGLSTEVVIVT